MARIVCILAVLALFGAGSHAADYSGIARLHPDYTLSWTVTTSGTATGGPVISFSIQVNCVCWVGLGWHAPNASVGGMSQADFMVATFDGKVSITDRYSTSSNGGYGPPVLDTDIGGANNILAWSAFQTSYPLPFTSVTFVKESKTGDTVADHPIVPGPTQVLWAHGNLGSSSPNQLQYHGFGNRGLATIDFFTNN